MSDIIGEGCISDTEIKIYPIASPLPVVCVRTPISIEKYKKRDYISEQKVLITSGFAPVKSQTPTPSITPTPTRTPSNTPTNTPTPAPGPSPTPTPTNAPYPTPTPSTTTILPITFRLQLSISVYKEVQIVFSLLDSSLLIYHASEGSFPANPVSIQWSTMMGSTVILSGSELWNIPWEYRENAQNRFLIGNISATAVVAAAGIAGTLVGGAFIYIATAGLMTAAAGSVAGALTAVGLGGLVSLGGTVSSAAGALGAGAGLGAIAGAIAIIGVVVIAAFAIYTIGKWLGLWGKKKPPVKKPYPQWSPSKQLNALIPKSSNFQLYDGIIPDHVTDGGIFVEWGPSPATAYTMSLRIVDNSPNAAKTLDPWEFVIQIDS